METLRKYRNYFIDTKDPCKKMGCPGMCCNHPHISMSDSERRRKFPNAIQVGESVDFKDNDLPSGEYWKDTGFKVGMNALIEYKAVDIPCPHKVPEGGCNIYNDRPEGCKHFVFGGEECNETRAEEGLIPVNQILINVRNKGGDNQ